jgi:hypothetical protein
MDLGIGKCEVKCFFNFLFRLSWVLEFSKGIFWITNGIRIFRTLEIVKKAKWKFQKKKKRLGN